MINVKRRKNRIRTTGESPSSPLELVKNHSFKSDTGAEKTAVQVPCPYTERLRATAPGALGFGEVTNKMLTMLTKRIE